MTRPHRVCSDGDKELFVIVHWDLFERISKHKWFPNAFESSVNIEIKYLAAAARLKLGYSPNTINIDIVKHLQRVYKRLNKIDNPFKLKPMNDFDHHALSQRIIEVCKQGNSKEKDLMRKLFPDLYNSAKYEIEYEKSTYPIGDLYIKSSPGGIDNNILLLLASPSDIRPHHKTVRFYNIIAHNHWTGSVEVHKDTDYITHDQLKLLVNGASTIRRMEHFGKFTKSNRGVFFETKGIPIRLHSNPESIT